MIGLGDEDSGMTDQMQVTGPASRLHVNHWTRFAEVREPNLNLQTHNNCEDGPKSVGSWSVTCLISKLSLDQLLLPLLDD